MPFSNYQPNFTLTGGNVPAIYQPGGLPAPIPAANVGGVGTDAASALASDPAVASTPGLLGRLVSAARMAAPYAKGIGIPMLAAGAALANDPGNLPEANPDGSADPLAHYLNPSPTETGLTSTLKGGVRGIASAGKSIDDAIGTGYNYLTESKAERELKADLHNEKMGGDTEASKENHYNIDQALGIQNIGGSGNQAPGALSGKFAVPIKQDTGKTLAQQILEMTAPSAGNGAGVSYNPDTRDKFEQEGMITGLNNELAPGMRGSGLGGTARALLGLGLGSMQGGTSYDQAIAARQLELKEKQADWGVKAADATTKGLEEQHKENMDQIRIHTTRQGVMVEGTEIGPDGKAQRVVQPIGNAIFNAQTAGALDPKATTTVLGKKFSNLNNNPLGKETALLGTLEQTGQLNSVMQDPRVAKLMAASDKITTKTYAPMGEAKLSQETYNGRRAVLLKAMVENPQFRQDMIDRVGNLRAHAKMGTAASALGGDMTPDWDSTPPGEGEDEFGTMLNNAEAQENGR